MGKGKKGKKGSAQKQPSHQENLVAEKRETANDVDALDEQDLTGPASIDPDAEPIQGDITQDAAAENDDERASTRESTDCLKESLLGTSESDFKDKVKLDQAEIPEQEADDGNLENDLVTENVGVEKPGKDLMTISAKQEAQEAHEFAEDDDDFGSFDEASFDEFEPAEETEDINQQEHTNVAKNSEITPEVVRKTLELLFPFKPAKGPSQNQPLLSEVAEAQFQELSKPPRLQPQNWTKLKLRHNLLLNLGVPINLDELGSSKSQKGPKTDIHKQGSISESDLDWSRFLIPDLDSLGLSPEEHDDMLEKCSGMLSKIETDNMSNTSELHLQKCKDETLDQKLEQMQNNYNDLLRLSSVWHEQIETLKANQAVFESVVQNMVGYNQKLQRNELIESLRRSKTKRGKKIF